MVKISALAYFQSFCFYLRTLSDSFGFCCCKYSGYKMCLSFRRPRLLDASLRHCQRRNLFLQVIASEVSGARQPPLIKRQPVVSEAWSESRRRSCVTNRKSKIVNRKSKIDQRFLPRITAQKPRGRSFFMEDLAKVFVVNGYFCICKGRASDFALPFALMRS
jgi:hypothetical protein